MREIRTWSHWRNQKHWCLRATLRIGSSILGLRSRHYKVKNWKDALLLWQVSSYHRLKLWYRMISCILVPEQWSMSSSGRLRSRFSHRNRCLVPFTSHCSSLRSFWRQVAVGNGYRSYWKVWRSWHSHQLCWCHIWRGHWKHISPGLRLHDGHQFKTSISSFKHLLSFSGKVIRMYCECKLYAWCYSHIRNDFL